MNTTNRFTRQTTFKKNPLVAPKLTNKLLLSVKNSSGTALPSNPYWHTIGKRTFGILPALRPLTKALERSLNLKPRCNQQVKEPSCLLGLSPCCGRVCLTVGNEPTCQRCLDQGKVTSTDQRPDNSSGRTEPWFVCQNERSSIAQKDYRKHRDVSLFLKQLGLHEIITSLLIYCKFNDKMMPVMRHHSKK